MKLKPLACFSHVVFHVLKQYLSKMMVINKQTLKKSESTAARTCVYMANEKVRCGSDVGS